MSNSDTPQSIGLQEAADRMAAFLEPEPDTQTPTNSAEATNEAETRNAVEAQQADDSADETPPSDNASNDELSDEDLAKLADEEEGAADEEATEEDEDASDEADPMEAVFTVKIDGKEEQVSLKEALAGYQRTQDYTRKAMALADEKREFHSERDSFREEQEAIRIERAQYAQLLPVLEAQLEAELSAEPDWDALIDTPTEFLRQQNLWREKQDRLAAAKEERNRLAALAETERKQAIQQAVIASSKELAKAMPEWTNPDKWKAVQEKLAKYGTQIGFSPDELAQTYDHRALLTLYKAMRFDEIMSKRPQPSQKPAGPKVLTAGSKAAQPARESASITRAKQRLAKTGSVADAASLFEVLL